MPQARHRAFGVVAALSIVAALAVPAFAEDAGPAGTLNPDELSLQTSISKAARGETSMVVCAQGYLITKSGNHRDARTVFAACAADGYTGAMTWMSQLDSNGLGAPEDPGAAAAWDRRAAEAGDSVGQFNYGLDLLRGWGVPQDDAAGRALVDRAADAGLDAARTLRDSGYDLDVATPDADNWKYQRVF